MPTLEGKANLCCWKWRLELCVGEERAAMIVLLWL